MRVFNEYLELTKPRLALMNVLVAAAAFVFGSTSLTTSSTHNSIDWLNFALMAAGLFGVVASACVFNNVADRRLDAKMPRTKHRALAEGRITPRHARAFAAALLAAGIALLLNAGLLPLFAALAGFFVYVFLYTPLKPKSASALLVGAVAGAMPPVVGYVAAAHALDWYALGLFLFLFLWQIPHFLAIARYRFDDYSAGGVPLMVKRPQSEQERKQAKKVFIYSLVALVLFCVVLLMLHR